MSKPWRIAGILALALAGIALFSLISVAPLAFIRAYKVSAASMEDTLGIGDRVLVGRIGKEGVKRGDVVIVVSPLNRDEVFVKRVVALAGDRLRIANRILYRNGEAQKEPYAKFLLSGPDPLLDNYPAKDPRMLEGGLAAIRDDVSDGELVVPEGHVFVLGDNRENSLDDRFTGPTPAADVVGKVLFVYAGSSLRRMLHPLPR